MIHKSFCVTVLLLFAMCLLVACDGYTRAFGSVRSKDGKPIEGATVILETGGRKAETKSQPDGSFSTGMTHAPLKVDLSLTVSKEGYKSFRKEFKASDSDPKFDVVLER